MELYRDGSNVEFLIHEDAGTKEARLHFRRGTRDWEIINNADLAIEVEDGEVFRITKAGNVGIGTKSPNHPLEMASGAHVTSGGVWINASSREYKENIRELTSQEALAALEELVPVQFNYEIDREDDYLGFIAEDVPALVASKNRKGLSSMDIVAVLTKVVKAQQKKIEELEKRFDEWK